ncbi:flagellar biosynthesis GTPase FlhF [Geomicrobium halophilum]|uniref:Flagellar biosynthesis GTPase FlhF n=1 Tax=Geomicrobium halophilum TaxID=549000 RepID=A0A841PJ68_9BACL|nr:hypothetical protein [Geomicrobium halophilum]MBB6448830.1 flagellar biosynthesis GTPase FlhF [Geomicrobium halophilum]
MDFVFLMILIFIASAIFNAINNSQQKKGSEDEKRSRPGTGSPVSPSSNEEKEGQDRPWGDLRKQFDDMAEHPTKRMPRAEAEIHREEQNSNDNEMSNAHSEYEQQKERMQRKKREAERRLQQNTDVSTPSSENQNRHRQELQTTSFQDLSSNDVVKGVIWSEVLGEPRSRKPHKTNRMARR